MYLVFGISVSIFDGVVQGSKIQNRCVLISQFFIERGEKKQEVGIFGIGTHFGFQELFCFFQFLLTNQKLGFENDSVSILGILFQGKPDLVLRLLIVSEFEVTKSHVQMRKRTGRAFWDTAQINLKESNAILEIFECQFLVLVVQSLLGSGLEAKCLG